MSINVDFPREGDPTRRHTPLRKIDFILLHSRNFPPYSKISLSYLLSLIILSLFDWTNVRHRAMSINVDFSREGDTTRTHTPLRKMLLHYVTFKNLSIIFQDISHLFVFIKFFFSHFNCINVRLFKINLW